VNSRISGFPAAHSQLTTHNSQKNPVPALLVRDFLFATDFEVFTSVFSDLDNYTKVFKADKFKISDLPD
jgi:hypothetical protein